MKCDVEEGWLEGKAVVAVCVADVSRQALEKEVEEGKEEELSTSASRSRMREDLLSGIEEGLVLALVL